MGKERESLSNVILIENTNNMKNIYSRARLLLMPSFGFESAGRVVAEAQLNGIPVIGSSSGGIPEMIGKGGIVIDFPKEFYKKPYITLAHTAILKKVASVILRFYNDKEYYEEYTKEALQQADTYHNIDNNTKKLIEAIHTLF